MARNGGHKVLRKRAAAACLLLATAACLSAAPAVAVSLATQGYVFKHPFFQNKRWKASLERLDLVLPQALDSVRLLSFDVSAGYDSAVAVYSAGDTAVFIMPVRCRTIIAPCFDNEIIFDDPQRVSLGGLTVPPAGRLYVVKDSVYRYDSLLLAVPAGSAPPRLFIATLKTASKNVDRIDTIAFAERRPGQAVSGVSGAADVPGGQDRGLWVAGTNGLLRYVPRASHQFGAEAIRDIPDSLATVTHSDGNLAGTLSGGIYRRDAADTFFTKAAATAAGTAVWRVYPQGVIGAAGLWKEVTDNIWRPDTALGTGNYRYANFIRRPGGFGIELLDTAWTYRVFTYRDTSSRIADATPDSLLKYVNGPVCIYQNLIPPVNLTLTLDDPDSNYSDYRLTFMPGGIDLKNDGNYSIKKLPDTADCHLGAIKMTSGRIRLALSDTAVKVMHDCAIGALNTTCGTCYWKKYDFTVSRRWIRGNSINIETRSQLLRIGYGPNVTANGDKTVGRDILQVRCAGCPPLLTFPLRRGITPRAVSVHDLQGRLIVSVSVGTRRHALLPPLPGTGTVLVTCVMSDGSSVHRRALLVR